MRRLGLVIGTALAAACAARRGGTAVAPAPGTSAPAVEPTGPVAVPKGPESVRYGPSALRYLIHRQLHIQQGLVGQEQAQDRGARVYLAATIVGPADSVGYPTMFTVDSIVPDSGTPQLVAGPVSRARRLIFSGRLGPRGEFLNGVPSDSAVAQSVVQLVGNFLDFFPHLPIDGAKPGAAWTDTTETTQKGTDGEGSRRSIVQAWALGWEDRGGVQTLRVESSGTYRLAGSGKNLGQPFELAGAGASRVTAFIAVDGRYLGGESHDSASLTYRLPVQGVAIPVIQVTRTTVAVLP